MSDDAVKWGTIRVMSHGRWVDVPAVMLPPATDGETAPPAADDGAKPSRLAQAIINELGLDSLTTAATWGRQP